MEIQFQAATDELLRMSLLYQFIDCLSKGNKTSLERHPSTGDRENCLVLVAMCKSSHNCFILYCAILLHSFSGRRHLLSIRWHLLWSQSITWESTPHKGILLSLYRWCFYACVCVHDFQPYFLKQLLKMQQSNSYSSQIERKERGIDDIGIHSWRIFRSHLTQFNSAEFFSLHRILLHSVTMRLLAVSLLGRIRNAHVGNIQL